MLYEDMRKVQTSKKTLIPTDKTPKMCRLNKNNYQNISRNAITIAYKKANKIKINKGVKFAKQADVLDKIEMNGTGNSFVTLKDRKENFMSHSTIRPINPSKNEIGRIREHILDQINTELVNYV